MTFRYKDNISDKDYFQQIKNTKEAYNVANNCRDKEIDRYWKRTGYF